MIQKFGVKKGQNFRLFYFLSDLDQISYGGSAWRPESKYVNLFDVRHRTRPQQNFENFEKWKFSTVFDSSCNTYLIHYMTFSLSVVLYCSLRSTMPTSVIAARSVRKLLQSTYVKKMQNYVKIALCGPIRTSVYDLVIPSTDMFVVHRTWQ